MSINIENITTNKKEMITNEYRNIIFSELKYNKSEVIAASLEYFKGDDLAASTFADKYALRDPLCKTDKCFAELTPAQMHRRISAELARIECNYLWNPDDVKAVLHKAEVNSDNEIYITWFEWFNYYLPFLENFKYIVPQGSPMYGIGNRFVNVSLSNCVVCDSPKDSMSGIMNVSKDLANLMKRRAGVGTDVSTLRPENTPTQNSSGGSTGAWAWSNHFSNVTREVAQLGRRGALMLTMDCIHPDADRFATMKQDLTYCTGANVSLKIYKEFMVAVENDDYLYMRFPVDLDYEQVIKDNPGSWVKSDEILDSNGFVSKLKSEYYESPTLSYKQVIRRVKAKDLWMLINDCARKTGEPGLIFWDNYTDNLPACCYPQFVSTSTNPCSEISLSPYDSCRLTSLNLSGFVIDEFSDSPRFDWASFKLSVQVGMRVMDNIVDLEIEALEKIRATADEEDERILWNKLLEAARNGRRTGLGTHGLADCLAMLKIKYDTEDAISFVDKIYSVFGITAYDASATLAETRGAFPAFNWELEKDNLFIQRLPKKLKEKMSRVGRRNISLLTNAPTGSVAIVSQTSSGIEPVFMNYYTRRRKINPSDTMTRVDFVDQNKDKWQEYVVFHHGVKHYLEHHPELKAQVEQIQATEPPSNWSALIGALMPDYFITAGEIDPIMRVRLQGALQKYIDHGVSSTINLPKGTSTETIANIYFEAWKEGLKGVTVYVDGSRTGVLVAAGETKQKRDGTKIIQTEAPKRPKELPCDIHRASVEGQYWTIFVGLMDGQPYEVFGGKTSYVEIPRRKEKGKIVKRKLETEKRSAYDLVIGEDDDQLTINDIAVTFHDPDYAWATRQLSLALRHGVPVKFMVEQLRRNNNSSLTHFSKAIARVLAKYLIEDGENENEENNNGIYCKSGSCE